jgi:hypothetical protein
VRTSAIIRLLISRTLNWLERNSAYRSVNELLLLIIPVTQTVDFFSHLLHFPEHTNKRT